MTSPPALPVEWVLGIATIVILAAAITAIYVIIFKPIPSLAQYRLTLFLICFALSTISCLLFAAKTELSGTLEKFTFTIAGPATMWLVVLLVINRYFPEDRMIKNATITLKEVGNLARELDNQEGWLSYNEWKGKLKMLQELIKHDEEFILESTLSSTYFVGYGHNKLTDPKIQTIFAYSGQRRFKLQRILGANPNTVEVFFKARTTIRGQETSYALLVMDNDMITAGYVGNQGDWQHVSSNPLDCLVIATYEEGMPPQGDFLSVDITKYLKEGSVTLDLGIMAFNQLKEPCLWEMKPTLLSTEYEVPLVFKLNSNNPSDNVGSLVSDLSPWLIAIDECIKQPLPPSQVSPQATNFLKNFHSYVGLNSDPSANFSTLLADSRFKYRCSFHAEGLRNPVITTFTRAR